MVRAVIIEDDVLAKDLLTDSIAALNSEINIICWCKTVESSLAFLSSNKPDLVFLDMQLPDGKGFDIMKQIEKIDFEIIVTTSYESYALDAIKYSALDYLMKPVKKEELKIALDKAVSKINLLKNQSTVPAKNKVQQHITRLAVPTSEGLLFLKYEDIIRLESDRNYTWFHTTNHPKILITKSMGDYELILSENGFMRVHNSHIINLNHILKYVKGNGGYVVMTDNSNVDIARRKKDEFLEHLAKA